MKMRTPAGIFAAWLACAAPLLGAESGFSLRNFYSQPPGPIPDGAVVSIRYPDGPEFLLGELVELELVLTNQGTVPINYFQGLNDSWVGFGDPRRNSVTGTGPDGTALRRATREQGPYYAYATSTLQLMPGEEIAGTIRLQDFVQLDQPGTYTISVEHDFGWTTEADQTLPAAEATFSVAVPTLEQAEDLVRDLITTEAATSPPDPLLPILPDGGPNPLKPLTSPGTITPFRYLSHPVYLPALEQAAAEGHLYALEGIHRIETIDATRSLLRLVEGENTRVGNAAALFLSLRMPPLKTNVLLSLPDTGMVRIPRTVGGIEVSAIPEEMVPAIIRTWVPEAAEPLRKVAARLLQSESDQYRDAGGQVFSFIGTDADAEVLFEALKPLAEYRPPDPYPLGYRDEYAYSPESNILGAFRALNERGYRAPEAGGLEVVTVRMMELADYRLPKPEGWEDFLEENFDTTHPVVGVAAVRALPRPLTERWADLLARALEAEDVRVRYAAVGIAGYSKDPRFIEPLKRIMRAEDNWYRMNSLERAISELAGPLATAEIYAEKLTEESVANLAIRYLARLIERPPGYGGESMRTPVRDSIALRDRWIQFLSEPDRQALIAEGVPIPLTENEARNLFGDSFRYYSPENGPWPPPVGD